MKWKELFVQSTLISFFADLLCIRLEGRNWSLFTLWSTSGAVSKQTWRDRSRVRVPFLTENFILCAESSKKVEKRANGGSHGTCREWLILSFQPCAYLFYLQLILRTWVPWLSAADVLCAVARLSRAVSTGTEMSVSLAYATTIYQALLTKRTVRSRWTKVCLCASAMRGALARFIRFIKRKI